MQEVRNRIESWIFVFSGSAVGCVSVHCFVLDGLWYWMFQNSGSFSMLPGGWLVHKGRLFCSYASSLKSWLKHWEIKFGGGDGGRKTPSRKERKKKNNPTNHQRHTHCTYLHPKQFSVCLLLASMCIFMSLFIAHLWNAINVRFKLFLFFKCACC